MSKPKTLLEDLCEHALSLGAQSIEVEYKDRREWVFAREGHIAISVANFASSSQDAKELRENLYAARKKPVRIAIGGQVRILKVHVYDSFGEDAFRVRIESAPKLDPSEAPGFTEEAGAISGVHLQLLEDPWPAACGNGSPAVLSDLAAVRSPDDQDARTRRLPRTYSRAGTIHTVARAAGPVASARVTERG